MPTLGPITRLIAALVGAWSLWGLFGAIHSGEWLLAVTLALVVGVAGYAAVTGLESKPPRG
jgi:hypothetical protein